jgi:hypothetical protein
MAMGHRLVREGIIVGAIGATAIAVWFFVVDLIAGRPLFTPSLLGEGLLGIFGMHTQGETQLLYVALYTVFHYGAFAIIGIVLTAIIHQGARTPGILAGLLIGFVAFELGAYMMTAVFMQRTPLRELAWYQVFLANLVAALAMGVWLWRRHPDVVDELRQALEGTDEYPGRDNTSAPGAG